MKKSFAGLIPDGVLNRKKKGFVRNWKLLLNHDIDSLLSEYISKDLIMVTGLNERFVNKLFLNKHKSPIAESLLWRLLILGIWFNKNRLYIK